MVKNSIIKLKKGKVRDLKAENGASHNKTEKSEPMEVTEVKTKQMNGGTKTLKQSLIDDNAYVSDLMKIINFPKREFSDDEDGQLLNIQNNLKFFTNYVKFHYRSGT